MNESRPTRREVIKSAAALGLLSAIGSAPQLFAQPAPRKPATIGIQMNLDLLARGDLDRLLGDLRERAGINTLFPFIYGYVPVWAGLPAENFQGGNFGIPHMEFYQNTTLTYDDMRAPDYGDIDVMARTIAAARKHDFKMFAWVLEHNRPNVPRGWADFYEIDFHGRRQTGHPSGPCYNNPPYRGFVLGLVEDYASSYDISGLMWASERQGGLWNALGAWHHGRVRPGHATCFCPHCLARAERTGIDADRARAGFAELETWVDACTAGQRPPDGYHVSFTRLLLKYPELLAWEKMWIDSRFDLMKAIRARVKSVRPDLPVGWHIWHNVSFNPYHRAEMDYREIAGFSDFIKPVLYANAAGERLKSFADIVGRNIFGDLGPARTLDHLMSVLGYEGEASYDNIVATGLSPNYVESETRRLVEDAASAGRTIDVWPGIYVNVPAPRGAHPTTPENVKAGVLAAFKGGASGVLLSRNYGEMTVENLNGAKAALQELGLV